MSARIGGIVATVAVALHRPPATAQLRSDWRGTVDSAVISLLASSKTTGAVVAMVADGKIVITAGYGLADRAIGAPMTDTSVINIASVSKPVSAWALLRLVESGRLGLDDPIGPRLSRWTIPPSSYDIAGVTIRRLLSHTAGLSVPAVPSFRADSATPSLEAVLQGDVGGRGPVQLTAPPGRSWSYSGGGFTVLELLVEETAGVGFEDFLRAEVFSPLGMTRTSLAPWARGVTPARQYDERGNLVPTYRYVGGAAGGWYASARDMARLLEGYHAIHEGRRRSLPFSAAVLAQIATPNVPVVLDGKEVAGAGYGLGHAVSIAGGDTVYYHSGGNPGSRAYLIVSPKRGLGLFVATNSDNGIPLITELRRMWGERYRVALPPLF